MQVEKYCGGMELVPQLTSLMKMLVTGEKNLTYMINVILEKMFEKDFSSKKNFEYFFKILFS